jgi:hypothetical protein
MAARAKKDHPTSEEAEDQPTSEEAEDHPTSEEAGRQLVAHVYVDGEVYGPGDDVPASVAKKITNPNAWSDGSK